MLPPEEGRRGERREPSRSRKVGSWMDSGVMVVVVGEE